MYAIQPKFIQVKVPVKQMFYKYDSNHNEYLDRSQIKNILRDIYFSLGIKNQVSEGDVDNFITDYDRNQDGKLSKSDFSNMTALNFYKTIEKIRLPEQISLSIDEIFNRYDHDNNGLLDFQELQQCLQSVFDRLGVSAKANLQDVIEFFKDYDVNGDGKITREDFKEVYSINFHSF